jgi:hypothetical protein
MKRLQPKCPDSYLTKTWGTRNWQNSIRYLQLEAFAKVRGSTKYGTLTRFFDLNTWVACVQLAYSIQIVRQTYTRNFGTDVMPLKSIQLKTPRLNEYSSMDMNREMYCDTWNTAFCFQFQARKYMFLMKTHPLTFLPLQPDPNRLNINATRFSGTSFLHQCTLSSTCMHIPKIYFKNYHK